ncbi:reverse transcriptase domain-containing protein [Tanacetum coccineum]
MVTSEGIRENPKKTKAIADMQSPRTLKEMQNLSGKLAALKMFLSLGLPLLTTHVKEETLYVYLAAATKAVSAVLLTKRKGKHCPIHYVSRTLNEAERNYAPWKSWPYHCYTCHGGYEGQVLADFLSEAPVGTSPEEFFRLPADVPNQDDVEKWTLFTDGASNNKGSGASGVEYTYALQLNFTSTNNEAEYEVLLTGLRMAKKMNVQDIDAKVDSKLVASQINGSYMASITSMVKYLATTKECIAEFRSFVIQNIPRNLNHKADILSKLATHAFDHLTKKVLVEVLAERPTMSSERYTWDPAECISGRGACSGAEAPQNPNDFNYGTMAILPMVNGHSWSPTPSLRKVKVRHSSHRLLHKMDRSKTVVTDNGTQFVNDPFKGWCEGLNIKQMNTAQSNGETPFSLTYGSEAVIPTKIGIREATAIREAKYKTKMEQYYNQKVRPMSFKLDKYVFRRNEASRVEDQGKLGSKWEGPYRVTGAYQNGSYKLQTMEGKEVPKTWHAINLRKCYV